MRSRFFIILGLLTLTFIVGQNVRAAGPVTSITITPTSTSITADQMQTFVVNAVAADGTVTDVTTQSTLSMNDPRGSVAGAVYLPGKAGTWTIQATYQSFTASASVIVTPGVVKEVNVNPNSDPEQTISGNTVTFTATAFDGHSNIVANQNPSWSVIGTIGTVSGKGVFTAGQIGTGKVQASLGSVTGQVSVVVNAAPVTTTNTNTTTVTNTAPAPIVIKNTNTVSNVNRITNLEITNTSTVSAPVVATPNAACTTLKPWAWTLMLVMFFLVVISLYALVSVTKIWPAVIALILSAGLAYIQRHYGCGEQQWWAWVITLGTVAITAAVLRMYPNQTVQDTN